MFVKYVMQYVPLTSHGKPNITDTFKQLLLKFKPQLLIGKISTHSDNIDKHSLLH